MSHAATQPLLIAETDERRCAPSNCYASGRATTFSPCRLYRYTLWREWRLPHGLPYPLPLHTASEFAMFIGLNPSTADETQDDPTIRKCVGFAKRWGYGALCMTNLFAFRATSPKDMKKCPRPIGEDNLITLVNLGQQAGIVLACWGVNGCFNHRDREVSSVLKEEGVRLHYLRLTKDGHPEHPLYIPYEVTPTLMDARTHNDKLRHGVNNL